MRFNKIAGSIAAATIVAAMSGTAHAQVQQNFASLTTVGAGANTAFTYTSGVGFAVTPGQASSFFSNFLPTGAQVLPTTFTLTGATNVGTLIAPLPGNDIYTQNLSGGTFSLTGPGGAVLLTGTYTNSVLTGSITAPPSPSASYRTELLGVTYTGGSYFTASGLVNPGSFSFGLNAIQTIGGSPGLQLAAGGTQFASFTAGGTGLFSATAAAVPEPSEWVAMGMAATSIGGLMFRAKLKLRTKRQQVAA